MRCPSWERRPTCDPLKTLLPTFGSYCKINIECVLPGTLGYSWCGVLAGIGCGGDGGCLTSFTPVTRAGVVELFISLLSSPTTTPDTDTHIELSESKKVFLYPLLPPSHQFNVDHENLQVVRWKLVSVEDNKNVWIEQHPGLSFQTPVDIDRPELRLSTRTADCDWVNQTIINWHSGPLAGHGPLGCSQFQSQHSLSCE